MVMITNMIQLVSGDKRVTKSKMKYPRFWRNWNQNFVLYWVFMEKESPNQCLKPTAYVADATPAPVYYATNRTNQAA